MESMVSKGVTQTVTRITHERYAKVFCDAEMQKTRSDLESEPGP